MRKPLGKLKSDKLAKRKRRALHIRRTVVGTETRPRLCVTKTNKHLRVQVIDDSNQKTLFSVQTFGKNAPAGAVKSVEGAKVIGTEVASKLKAAKLETVVFDRAGFKYTGVIASLANAVREAGIKV